MAYEANRGDKEFERARANANNTNNVRNAADVAIATKTPYGVAAGGAVKIADKVSGGKASESLGKALTKVNEVAPGGQKLQDLSNKVSESGAGNLAARGASMKNGMASKKSNPEIAKPSSTAPVATTSSSAAKGAKAPNEGSQIVSDMSGQNQNLPVVQNVQQQPKTGEGQKESSPFSDDNKKIKKESSITKDEMLKEDEESSSGSGKGLTKFLASRIVVAFLLIIAPLLIIILIIITVLSIVTGVVSEYDDAFGMSYTIGEETGNLEYSTASQEQQDFYNRIKEVKMSYQTQGKNVDALKLVAIYHVISTNNADITYKKIGLYTLETWADAMFDGTTYNENLFKENLINKIFPLYLSDKTQKQREELADEVLNYIDRYYDLIGKEANVYTCASTGNCSYDIKGFSIPGAGNVTQRMNVSNLKVRLMECGSPFGNGSDTKAIDQPLVNFEDYVAGVAYAEVGPDANIEVMKAQMVVARSFALSRPAAMNGAAGKSLNQETGGWVLQIASCVSDQVFCNIDEGCSYMGGGDGQGGIVKSGKVAGAERTRDPLPQNHPIRQAAAETQGEVLVNDQGLIIASGYLSSDQNKWAELANSGLNYKQILMQHYNQGNRNYGVKDIKKNSCSTEGNSNCISTGEYASWKQTDPAWGSVPMGSSGKNIAKIGCLVTSVAMQIAKSGVPVDPSINPFNPGTFVEFLNKNGGFTGNGNFIWGTATKAAPQFVYKGQLHVSGMSQQQKLRKIQDLVSQPGIYAVAEVKGNTGQHWVAIDSVSGTTINMMDPGSDSTDMWGQYNWSNTSTIAYYQVG